MKWVKLGDVAEKVDYGFTEKASKKKIGPKFLRITDIQKDKVDWDTVPYCKCNEKEFKKNKLKSGDIVFARTGATTGKSFLIDELEDDTVYASYLIRLRLKPKDALPEFVSFFFKSETYWRQISEDSDGATLPSFNATKLKNLQIPLPSLSEQRAIVEKLDRAQRLIDIDREMLQRYDALIQSVFLEMFGDPVRNPKGWEVKSVGEVANLITKGSSPNWQGFDYVEDGVRFVTSQNVRLGYLDFSTDKFIPHEFHIKLNRSQLKAKDILVNLVGASIGRGAIVTKAILPANINQAVAKIELNLEKVNAIFFLNLLITPQIQDILIGNKVEGARANISLKNVREQKVYLPPIELQMKFQKYVDSIVIEKQKTTSSLEFSESLFSSLVQQAFSKN